MSRGKTLYSGLFMSRPRVEQGVGLKPEAQAKFVRSPASLALQASIFACHLFRGEGGVTGPDLTLAANKFAARELLMHIAEPSKIDDVRIWKHALVDEQVRNLIAP